MLNKSKKVLFSVLVLILFLFVAISVAAMDTVKIGAIYPLTGPLGAYGNQGMNVIELAVDIINGEYPDLGFNLAPTAGLPNLGGAKIEIIPANTQGAPEFGRSEAERLITINKVDALMGCYQSGVTKTASQVAERYKVPFITGNSTASELTERGYKYFFRISLTDMEYAEDIVDFLKDLNQKKGANIKNIALVYADMLSEVENANTVKKVLSERGEEFNVVADIKFPLAAMDLDGEVTKLKSIDPDFILLAVAENDLITYVKSVKKLNYNVKVGIAGNLSGLLQALDTLGEDVEYMISKDVFSLDFADKSPLTKKTNEMYKDRYGTDLDLNNSREFVAIMVLADAINRAGSTDKEAIRKALTETDMPADQMILPWEGIKFNEKGQNIYGQWIFRQVIKGELLTVWPFDVAAAEVVFPMPKWDER